MKINRQMYLDKVKACWTAKNIGGTIGGPYEGTKEMLNISGYSTPKGKALPNDDLDLQLLWLCAVEEQSIRKITPQLLGEYWLNYIPPHWNEYGVAKANMRMGLVPPFSGEYCNDLWRHSNGAWIRTEIWACLFPGYPELAVRYAYADASVDHGMGEGTYAAMFVAALQSMAFFHSDIKWLIEKSLSFIPADCRIARSVKRAEELYDKKVDFAEARNRLVEETKDLGWFQAPANVGFVILGLLYGEGDFKKTMIYTVNCGDDTDCTGGTAGSILGIMGGNSVIPQDWVDYIGDDIVSISVDLSYMALPKTCSELTQRVYELMPSALKAYGMFTEYTDGENELMEYPDLTRIVDYDIPKTGLSCDLPDMIFAKGRVELSSLIAKTGEELKLKFIFKNAMRDPKHLQVKVTVPEGWMADKEEIGIYLEHLVYRTVSEESIAIIPNENIKGVNKILIEVSSVGRPTCAIMPIIVFSN